MKRAFGFASLLAVAGLTGILMHGSGTDPGRSGFGYGLSSQGGFEAAAPAKSGVDTFKLLVRDAVYPPAVAADSTDASGDPWVFTDGHYDTIISDTDGSHLRYASVRASVPDTIDLALALNYGSYSGRSSTPFNASSAPYYYLFFWFDISDIPANSKVEDAWVIFNTRNGGGSIDLSPVGSYMAAVVDTNTADFEMLNGTANIVGYPKWMDISWNSVNNTFGSTVAWSPALNDRLDWNDFGPTGDHYSPGYAIVNNNAIRLDLADPVQQVVDNGNQGRGVIVVIRSVGTAATANGIMIGNGSLIADGNPALTVTTTSRRGATAWGGARVPVSFTWDDTRTGQKECFPSFITRGHKLELVAYGDSWDAGDDSLLAADGAKNFPFIAHTVNHNRLGDYTQLTGTGLDSNLVRLWYPREIDGFSATDTSSIIDFAWTGGTGTKVYGFPAIHGMINNGYRTCRGTGYYAASATPIGEITFPSWDGFVNLYAINSLLSIALWGSDASPKTQAEFNEELTDYIDKCYTRHGKSAALIYSHGQANGTTSTTIEWLFDYIDSHTGVEYVEQSEIMERLASRPLISPLLVTMANGSTAENETSAAKYDSLMTADGTAASWATQVWVGPNGYDPATEQINSITVANIPRLGVAFPGNVGSVDFGLLDALGIGMVRTNLKWSSGVAGVSGNGTGFLDTLDAYGMSAMLTLCPEKTDSTATGTGTARDGMPLELDSWHKFVKDSAELLDGDGSGDAAQLGDPVIYYGILNEWTGHNNTDGGWRGAYTDAQISALIDTTKDALSSALGSQLVLGAPAGIYTDIMMMCDGVVTYTIKNESVTYTLDDCADADTDSMKWVISRAVDRSSIDLNDVHQYGPLEHNIARYAYTDSMWSAVGVVSSEAGGPSLNYDESPSSTDYFNYAWHLNLDAFVKDLPFTMWLQLFDTGDYPTGNESAGNDDVPFLVGDGSTVTTYRPQWYAYKMLALCFEDASTCTRMEEGVYKVTLNSGEDIYMMLAGFGDGSYTMPAGSAPVQAIKITSVSAGTYVQASVPAAGDVVNHGTYPMIVSEKVLIN